MELEEAFGTLLYKKAIIGLFTTVIAVVRSCFLKKDNFAERQIFIGHDFLDVTLIILFLMGARSVAK